MSKPRSRKPSAIRYSMQEKLEFLEHIALRRPTWECCIWPFNLSRGYGAFDEKRAAHRYVCELTHGPAPSSNHDAAHTCGIPSCVNPLHIVWKTKKANCADKLVHDTHSRGERGHGSKLTNEQAAEIRRRSSGMSDRALAREYGVSHAAIWLIRHGKTYVPV